MNALKTINLALAFLLELALFASLALWGFQQGRTTFTRYAYAIGLTLLGITLWGVLAAPRSAYRLPFAGRLVFELILFLTGAGLLYLTGRHTAGLLFAGLVLVSVLIAFLYKQ
ncbi:YrdB family protein [Fibrella sp. WM1]|uniref:YrdB family protein n=1 Tax=Fibrella musci TaxID=3242485 RepID=UPI003521CCD3